MTDMANTATDLTATLEKEPAAAPAPGTPRKIPEIDPQWMKRHDAGFCFAHFFARAPFGLVLDDLKEPSIWRRAQGVNGLSLKKLDRVTIVSHDETWIADAIVVAASADDATISKPSVVHLPTRSEFLMEDEKYRIVWVGNGYRVQRKKDGQFITSAVQSKSQAERDLSNQYSRSVSDPR